MGTYVNTVIIRYSFDYHKVIVTTFVIQQSGYFDEVNIALKEGDTAKEIADKLRSAADAIEKAMND